MFRGEGVAMVTPMHGNGEIDYKGLEKLTEHLIARGADYLVVMGTTGESATLTGEEQKAVLNFVCEVNKGRKPIVLGVGGNNTREVIDRVSKVDPAKVQGILSVSPYYNKPSQNGIYSHFAAIAHSTELPIILYNVPPRTGSNMHAETTLQLAADFSHIVAIKEASGDLEQAMAIIDRAPRDFMVISGEDSLTLPMIACGAQGVITVVGNTFPGRTSKMVHAALEGNMEEARKWHYALMKIIPLLFREGNPAGIKEALKHLNICEHHMRLPLAPVSETLSKTIYRTMAENDLME